ncbi:MAG: carboxypeptidase-like regulatory domain-containing protein [Planctomycetota bacterium]|jgi:hypothetical protein
MKLRLPLTAAALLAAALFLAGAIVPPYGGGPEQVLRAPASVSTAVAPVSPPPSPDPGKGLLYGTLRDAKGQALPGGRIAARDLSTVGSSFGISYFATCDADGRYVLNLKPGEYAVEYAGGPLRKDNGQTTLERLSLAASDSLSRDYRLAGDSALVVEAQLDRMGGVEIQAELLDDAGRALAVGHGTSGTTLLRRGTNLLFKSGDIRATRGRGLCFEGLPAGDFRLRLYLNRELGLSLDVPVRLESGKVLDLKRLKTSISDYTQASEALLGD